MRHLRRDREGEYPEYLPCDKHQEVSLHERKIDFSYKQMLDKPEYNTQVLSAKANNLLFYILKLDLGSLRKQS